MKELEIVQQIKNGDVQAFRDLYDLYFEYAMRVATVVMNHQSSNAKDAVQETFIRVYQNIKGYDTSRPFKPWFYRILINECHRILKRNGKIISVGEGFNEAEQDELAYEGINQFIEHEDLYKAIESLEHHHRVPIVLKYLNGFKEQEIAEILDENLNTIKSRLYKGRQKLKGLLKNEKEGSQDG